MNIAMISLYLPSQDKIGSGYQAHYMANAMVRRGHRVTMMSPAPRPHDAVYDHRPIAVGNSLRTFRFAWNLRQVNWKEFDVLHAHGDDYWLFTRRHPVHVRTMHGSCLAEALHVPRWKEKLRMAMLGLSELLATAAADATVCVSQNTLRYYPWVKRVIVNGVDTATFSPEARQRGEAISTKVAGGEVGGAVGGEAVGRGWGERGGEGWDEGGGEGCDEGGKKTAEPTILFVGTYQNRKRGKLLVDAFTSVIRPALPAARLWMVCNEVPETPGVEVLGRLTTIELAERYRRAWVFCLPSSYEGFGVPYIEAMASGTPVVATGNVGAREVLEEGRYGVIVEPEQLGAAVLQLLHSEPERNRLRELGLQRARTFAWDAVVKQYEALYAELMGGRAVAGHLSRASADSE